MRSQTESESGTEIGKGTATETVRGMMGGKETEESRGETIRLHIARAKEVMFSSVSLNISIFKLVLLFYMNECYVLFSGRKDDEMDPMDPSAYSDAPRYSTDDQMFIKGVLQQFIIALPIKMADLGARLKHPSISFTVIFESHRRTGVNLSSH